VKRTLSILLLLLFCSQYLIKLSVIINFSLYQEEIIANCCINKNRPELECYGKCYLQKQIRTVDNNTIPHGNSNIKKYQEIDFFIIQDTEISFNSDKDFISEDNYPRYESNYYGSDIIFGLLKPPQSLGLV